MSAEKAHELIDRIFKEEALVLGGLAAERRMDDAVVWQLVRSFDTIRGRAHRQLRDETHHGKPSLPASGKNRPHPAIEDFLVKLKAA